MDPLFEKDQASEPLRNVAEAAPEYLAELDTRLVDDGKARALLADLDGPLPEHGIGSVDAVTDLLRVGTATATHSSGPRFFHFVMGGATPAAMAGDWLTSLLDQNAGLWTASPLATTAETVALRWLKEMFGLPASWGGVLTPSATFANLTGLACCPVATCIRASGKPCRYWVAGATPSRCTSATTPVASISKSSSGRSPRSPSPQ